MTSTLEGGDINGVAVDSVDRIAIADIGQIENCHLMHAGEVTVYEIHFRGGGRVDISAEANGRIAGMSSRGECCTRLEGRTLVLEG